jgi:hypothetical protein
VGALSELLSFGWPVLEALMISLVPSSNIGALLGAATLLANAAAMVTPVLANWAYQSTAGGPVFGIIGVVLRGFAVVPTVLLALWSWQTQIGHYHPHSHPA